MNNKEFISWLRGYLDGSGELIHSDFVRKIVEKLNGVVDVSRGSPVGQRVNVPVKIHGQHSAKSVPLEDVETWIGRITSKKDDGDSAQSKTY